MPMLRLSLRLYATHPLETLRLYILSRLHTPARTCRLYTPRNVSHVTLHTTRCHGDPPPHRPQLDNAALSGYTQHTRISWRRRGVAIHDHPHTRKRHRYYRGSPHSPDEPYRHDGVTSCYAIPTRLNAHLTRSHIAHDKPHTHALHAPHAHDSEPDGSTGGRGGYPRQKRLGRLWF